MGRLWHGWMDGCVYKLSNHSLRTLLRAFNKSSPMAARTTLLQIDVQVGRI
jgi:hypothetical protein